MILIDTSVLIDYVRSKDAGLLLKMQNHGGAICGVVRAEVLAGARNPRDRARLLLLLDSFPVLNTPEFIWDAIGDGAASLRIGGVNLPLPDVVIAALAISNNIELWTRDGHFVHVQRVLPSLRLFVEPP